MVKGSATFHGKTRGLRITSVFPVSHWLLCRVEWPLRIQSTLPLSGMHWFLYLLSADFSLQEQLYPRNHGNCSWQIPSKHKSRRMERHKHFKTVVHTEQDSILSSQKCSQWLGVYAGQEKTTVSWCWRVNCQAAYLPHWTINQRTSSNAFL